jgi:hypothetical protein
MITHPILDLAPSNYHLFPGLKEQLKGRHFSSDPELTAASETWLDKLQHSSYCLKLWATTAFYYFHSSVRCFIVAIISAL